MWHPDLFHKQNSLQCTMGLFHPLGKGRGGGGEGVLWEEFFRGSLNGCHAGVVPL